MPLRLFVCPEPTSKEADQDQTDPVAEVRGINLHARQSVNGTDRRQLERLCRYITRPPLSQDRLERRADGKLEFVLKKVWKDGTRALLLDPEDLVVRLIAAVPPPGFHLLRYFWRLSSHSRLRSEVVPRPPSDPAQSCPPPASGDQLELLGEDTGPAPTVRAESAGPGCSPTCSEPTSTLARSCGGPMRWLDVATTQQAAAHLLARLGLLPQPPPVPTRASVAQLEFAFDKRTR